MELPSNLLTIKDEAFRGVSMKSIDLPEGLQTIGVRAFAYTGLESVYIPASVTKISNYAFEGCANLQPIVVSDSYGETWCVANNSA